MNERLEAMVKQRALLRAAGEDTSELDAKIAAFDRDPRVERAVQSPAVSKRGH